MPYCYLLDTNILSDLVKHPMGKIFSKIQSIGEDKICTSVIVAWELRFGAEKSKSSRLKERIALTLDNLMYCLWSLMLTISMLKSVPI